MEDSGTFLPHLRFASESFGLKKCHRSNGNHSSCAHSLQAEGFASCTCYLCMMAAWLWAEWWCPCMFLTHLWDALDRMLRKMSVMPLAGEVGQQVPTSHSTYLDHNNSNNDSETERWKLATIITRVGKCSLEIPSQLPSLLSSGFSQESSNLICPFPVFPFN